MNSNKKRQKKLDDTPKKECPITEKEELTAKDMARVIVRLDSIQASIDRLLAICLQEELEECLNAQAEDL